MTTRTEQTHRAGDLQAEVPVDLIALATTHVKVRTRTAARNVVTGLRSSTMQIARAVPRWLGLSFAAFTALVVSLSILSFSIGNVMVHQGFETIALAKPAAMSRVVRQSEVIQFGSKVSRAFGIDHGVATEFSNWILEASERQLISPELLASLVVTESSFRKTARSNVGAVGPTQVRPDYWGNFCGAADLLDPEENVYCGAQVLSYLLERCNGDRACALGAYNVGPYVNREGAARRYVTKVDRYLASFETDSQTL